MPTRRAKAVPVKDTIGYFEACRRLDLIAAYEERGLLAPDVAAQLRADVKREFLSARRER